MKEFTHVNANGEAHMVDVGDKLITKRTAKARARVFMQPETLAKIQQDGIKKGDVLASARIAGIMAAKNTHHLIPLCHALPIQKVSVECVLDEEKSCVEIVAEASCQYKTGIEMEVITAASIAAITVYDMCKAIDRSMLISDIALLEKTGGKEPYFRPQID